MSEEAASVPGSVDAGGAGAAGAAAESPTSQGGPGRATLPRHGTPPDEVLRRLGALRQRDAKWHEGRVFSLVYHAGDEHTELLKQAYGLFLSENALNPMAFPSLAQMENEVVSMAAGLLSGDAEACGTLTSGGSESLLMACKTYRDRARAERPAVTQPEMIVPATVHPALMKAAHYLCVKPVVAPVGPDFRVDVAAVRERITPNTIFLVGSAPPYPHGVIDPIEELGALAQAHGLGLHVDACVGGFMLPFVERLGYKVPRFDFRVPGVTSISADVHKYGYAAKGVSTILYRNKELRKHQFFAYTDWPGGLFVSTTMQGTRPGGAIAAAWACLNALGEDGYLRLCRGVMETSRALITGIAAIPGLRVLGEPAMSVFAFTADGVDLFAIADGMEARGWHMDRQQLPSSIHMMITPAHAAIVEPYLRDLREVTLYVAAHPELSAEGNAAMYGMLAQVPERAMVRDFIVQLFDNMYRG